MSIEERKLDLIKRFRHFSDWDDRYRQLIAYGRKLAPMDRAHKTSENLVPGCLSKVWLACEKREGRLYFQGDSDASIVKGMVGLLLYVYSGATPAQIVQCSCDFLQEIQLQELLSLNRRNGLTHMVRQIQDHAACTS